MSRYLPRDHLRGRSGPAPYDFWFSVSVNVHWVHFTLAHRYCRSLLLLEVLLFFIIYVCDTKAGFYFGNMGKKRSQKRQKTENAADTLQPLGSKAALLDDSAKDDEERRLESALFGVPYVPGRKKDEHVLLLSDNEDDEHNDLAGGNELQALMDSDVSHYRCNHLNDALC